MIAWLVSALGCSSTSGGSDEAPVVPPQISVMALAGGNGVLELKALTLQESDAGAALYAALRNVGTEHACAAALSVELFDAAEAPLATGLSGMHAPGLYRLADGSAIAACVAPRETAMVAIEDLPAELIVEDVHYVVYRCSYFALDVVPIAGPTLRDIARTRGGSYAGTLVNELDVAVTDPSVTLFPINRVGRPLGVARASEATTVLPGASWMFETTRVETDAVAYVAYPAAALGRDD